MPVRKTKKALEKTVKIEKQKGSFASSLQKAAFTFGIIGVFIPFFPIVAIVLGAVTKKELPDNWRAKWAIGLGIFGILTSFLVIFAFISYLALIIGNIILG
ncbi:TPA: hypothetical protein DD449_00700 [Candidatus Berkelbacteria bacterium]|uniref:DUF4190 domain-containing protein n=1 Tax=Berkelbacteria bacterium GW2011_GWE1_39_12 TaxID=1618337 RepID=A0A0G4B5R2_9BACT|nr:MAG: hypothetical protein UT28_C0001G0946 [Berkelbacteria bacterium GW2011_GWE1_39_12]HBO60190.1 hypothetical protein [Candidatus Berkelbacteria bacterium]